MSPITSIFPTVSRIALLAAAMAGLPGCATGPVTTTPATAPVADAVAYSFAVWGDMPYRKAGDLARLPAVLASLNASDIAFSIYDGDIKDGGSPCTDEVYREALTMFNSLRQPAIYIPGDNEWTDCHRLNSGGHDPLERLAHLRRVMYPSLDSLGQSHLPLEHQGRAGGDKFIENIRFSRGPVLFVGLNVPGSNNNVVSNAKECSHKSARKPADCDAANAEFLERDAANIHWLEEGFRLASSAGQRGVVVVFQGDPGFDLPETEDIDESLAPEVSGYRHFMSRLVDLTAGFKGEVLMVHGDTHFFKVDKPLYSPTRLLPNFTRLQTFGSPSLHWVKVSVRPQAAALFQIEPVIVP